jgi:hypothetical protein
VILIGKELLARIIVGMNREEDLRSRSRFRAKLFSISKHANEILLWRQLKVVGAKAVWIPKNRNGYSRAYAVAYFKNLEEKNRAINSSIKYFEYRLEWEDYKNASLESKNENSSISKYKRLKE